MGEFRQRGHIERVTHLPGHGWQLGIVAILGIQILLVLLIFKKASTTITEFAAVDTGTPVHGDIAIDRHLTTDAPPFQGQTAAPFHIAGNPDNLVRRGGDNDVAPGIHVAGDGRRSVQGHGAGRPYIAPNWRIAVEHYIGLVTDGRHLGILLNVGAAIFALARIVAVDKTATGEAEPFACHHRILKDEIAGLALEGKQRIKAGISLQIAAMALQRQLAPGGGIQLIYAEAAARHGPFALAWHLLHQLSPLYPWFSAKGLMQGSITLVHPLFGTELCIDLLVKIAAQASLQLVLLNAGKHQQTRQQAHHQHHQQYGSPLPLQSLVHPAPPAVALAPDVDNAAAQTALRRATCTSTPGAR